MSFAAVPTGESQWWHMVLVTGAVVLVIVVVLLSLLIWFVKIIDREVVKVRDTLQSITQNTANAALIPQTADGVDAVLAEGLQHHLFLGRVMASVAAPAAEEA